MLTMENLLKNLPSKGDVCLMYIDGELSFVSSVTIGCCACGGRLLTTAFTLALISVIALL